MLAKISMTANLEAFLPYAHHALIIGEASGYSGECSPIDSVSKITKMCDYHAGKYSKFIAYNLILIGCIVFIRYWQSVSTLVVEILP